MKDFDHDLVRCSQHQDDHHLESLAIKIESIPDWLHQIESMTKVQNNFSQSGNIPHF